MRVICDEQKNYQKTILTQPTPFLWQIFFHKRVHSIDFSYKVTFYIVSYKTNIERDIFADIRRKKVQTTENCYMVSIYAAYN